MRLSPVYFPVTGQNDSTNEARIVMRLISIFDITSYYDATNCFKKVINGWAMYDWANSVYNLVITTTFFPIYFLAVTSNRADHKVSFLGREFVNSSLYDYVLAAAYLLIALLYPILTSIADTRGNKKNFMRFFLLYGRTGL